MSKKKKTGEVVMQIVLEYKTLWKKEDIEHARDMHGRTVTTINNVAIANVFQDEPDGQIIANCLAKSKELEAVKIQYRLVQ